MQDLVQKNDYLIRSPLSQRLRTVPGADGSFRREKLFYIRVKRPFALEI